MKNDNEILLLCDCSSEEHQLIVRWDNDDKEVYVSVHLAKINIVLRCRRVKLILSLLNLLPQTSRIFIHAAINKVGKLLASAGHVEALGFFSFRMVHMFGGSLPTRGISQTPHLYM